MSNLFPWRPETPLVETLRFLTDVQGHKDGTEQRMALRVAPRQEWTFNVFSEDDLDRQRMDNMLYGAPGGVFLVPAWTDVTFLTSPLTATSTTLAASTVHSDFRAGGRLLLISADDTKYELVEGITAFDGTSITWTTGVANTWPAGTEVYPVRECMSNQVATSSRYPTNARTMTVQFAAIDNDTPLYIAGTTTLAFSALGLGPDTAKILVDDPNFCDTTLGETTDSALIIVDGNVGALSPLSYWKRSRRGSVKSWITTDRQKLWDVRVLLHYLAGRRTSFMLPTFQRDLTPVANITSGTATMDVANAGNHSYAAVGSSPHRYVRIELADGTRVIKQISSVAVIDANVERLTMSANFAASIAYINIVRVQFLEKVRIDAEDLTLTHSDLWGSCLVAVPVKAVLE